MSEGALKLFALEATGAYGEAVARHLGVPLSAHEERGFEDGEHKARPLVSVRGADVYVVQSLYGDDRQSVNDKLCRLLFFIGALKDAAAGSVTAIVPYLCYARKDRKTKPRDPVTTRYVARLFEAVGTDRVVTLDVHNLAAFQNAFRCQTEHLEARPLFVRHFAGLLGAAETAVVSPDVGGVKRAERFTEALSLALGRPVPVAFMDKQRSAGVVTGDTLVGDVEGRSVILIDDMISTGTTMRRAAAACRDRGAARIHAAATHGVFSERANEIVADPVFDSVVVTDSVPPVRLSPDLARERVRFVEAAGLFAEAIRRLHDGGSIVELVEEGLPPDTAAAVHASREA